MSLSHPPCRLNHVKGSTYLKSCLETGNIVTLQWSLPSSLMHCIFNKTFSLIVWIINYLKLSDTSSFTNVFIFFFKLYVICHSYRCLLLSSFPFSCSVSLISGTSSSVFSYVLPLLCMTPFQNCCSHDIVSGH